MHKTDRVNIAITSEPWRNVPVVWNSPDLAAYDLAIMDRLRLVHAKLPSLLAAAKDIAEPERTCRHQERPEEMRDDPDVFEGRRYGDGQDHGLAPERHAHCNGTRGA